jgi:hypothetical protein
MKKFWITRSLWKENNGPGSVFFMIWDREPNKIDVPMFVEWTIKDIPEEINEISSLLDCTYVGKLTENIMRAANFPMPEPGECIMMEIQEQDK